MPSEEFVTIAKFSDAQEASMVRARLESEGISGLVTGGEINNTLWHLGPTIAGVELKVASEQAEQAAELLESFRETKPSASHEDWTCPKCGEHVEAGFDVCWSCGAVFGEAEEVEGDVEPVRSDEKPPEATTDEPSDVEETEEPTETADEQAYRAFRAALIGLIFFPAAIYALFLLLDLSTQDLGQSALKRYYQATGMVLLVLTLIFGILLGL